ncbi:transmembrane protein 18-like [Haliotis rufescens]|uniref:transmembrane protein 18-like n=1 Tax=Haliotis rufescens TaxID=6454 RepID=UPI001EAF9CBA|nr:transmembrane protein 18-like [Haliotis rufescens]
MEPTRTDEIDGLWSYLNSIDWSECWLWCLGGFHVMCALMTYLTRQGGPLQAVYFVVLLMLVYFAENLNTIAAQNWKKFSRQQYFDSGGLFISVVYSVPLLVNCLVIVIMWLLATGTMMVKMKKMKLKHQARNKQKEEEKKEEEKTIEEKTIEEKKDD